MEQYNKEDLIRLLSSQGNDYKMLMKRALETKKLHIGNTIYLRGLIEYSNICRKNCFYCGVRKDNKIVRYQLSDEEVYQCADMAMELGYGSLAIQSGERNDREFTDKITELVFNIKQRSNNKLGITLSCGEQKEEVYKEWFDAGAHRYLLRIESSTPSLYYKIHPQTKEHDFETRLNAVYSLLSLGYQVGTGVMIGLPFQTIEHLADDLLFFKKLNVAMVGMGPFIPHPDTPLWQYHTQIPDDRTRLQLTMKMIACLRLMMPKINMVAATANQTLAEDGREQAVLAGANIIMPNLTPTKYREQYLIYPDKACVGDKPNECRNCLYGRMKKIGHEIGYNLWGDSQAFLSQSED
ncbi:MAG: [FeFe] hydrogenase H-cluster radical SAM maturase HydE [Bacteroidales bacterium]|jgi:biotin synthase|nr:[FeFe] hydrogenase H-cluster radical SAM maturase HydE [Bacteroidales bacterium]